MTPKKLDSILEKYHRQGLSENEFEALLQALSDPRLKEQFESSVALSYLASLKKDDIDFEKAYGLFLEKREQFPRPRAARPPIYRYAAIFVGLIILGLLYFTQRGQLEPKIQPQGTLKIAEEDIILKSGDGSLRVIQENGGTSEVVENGKLIATQNGGKLTYGRASSHAGNVAHNELYVPYGKRFAIELSDGSTVHLNSGSSLRYPVVFPKAGNRKVTLRGEAFFTVSENRAQPFLVDSGPVAIEVLGTRFNVSSYAQEETRTVLVSGKVRLAQGQGQNMGTTSLELLPEQMGTWNEEHLRFDVQKVDVEAHTAWLSGKLVFRGTPFKVIRKRLERKYNVTIVNNNDKLDGNRFHAVFDIESIEEVLETFRRNFGVKYGIVDNQVMIY